MITQRFIIAALLAFSSSLYSAEAASPEAETKKKQEHSLIVYARYVPKTALFSANKEFTVNHFKGEHATLREIREAIEFELIKKRNKFDSKSIEYAMLRLGEKFKFKVYDANDSYYLKDEISDEKQSLKELVTKKLVPESNGKVTVGFYLNENQ